MATFAVYSQVRHYDFVNYDDPEYVTQNAHVRAGLTAGGAITGVIDRLEAAGLVHRVRDEIDRRRVLVTPKRGLGRAYIDAIPFIRGKYVLLGDADLTYDFRQTAPFIVKKTAFQAPSSASDRPRSWQASYPAGWDSAVTGAPAR